MRIVIFIIPLLLSSKNAYTPQVIYGKDHRREIPLASKKWRRIGRSVAAQIPIRLMLPKDNGDYQLKKTSWEKYCPAERFYGNPLVATCTGFLVSNEFLLTIGHCGGSCTYFYWVFDYHSNSSVIPKENVYSCSEVITLEGDRDVEGFALVRLSSLVSDRSPLPMRKTGKIPDNARVAVLGHPLGLPLILDVGDGKGHPIRDNSPASFFKVDFDTYVGSSGSPVINVETEVVEGILAGGEEDFEHDVENDCRRSKHCLKKDCLGESIVRPPFFEPDMQLPQTYLPRIPL